MALQKGEGRYEILYRPWSVTGRSDEFDAWFAQPDVPGRFSTVLLAHDIWGLTPSVKEFAKILARMGYVVVCPNFYYRIGWLPPEATRDDAVFAVGHVSDGRMSADLEDTLAFCSSFAACDVDRIGLLGMGFGGRLSILFAAQFPEWVRSVVAISPEAGKMALPETQARDRDALTELVDVQASLMAIFASKDDLTPAKEIETFQDAAPPAANLNLVTYPDCQREFLDESSGGYDAAATTDALGRILGFLDATLGPKPI